MLTGADTLFSEDFQLKRLKGRRLGFLGHAASLTRDMTPTLDRLLARSDLKVTALFSPQHGFSGVKQANMIESADGVFRGLPLFSLYSRKTRRLTEEMKAAFDVLLIDLQDAGCRVYTYLTTVSYLLEDCREIALLDRPNPAGRAVEGGLLQPGFESFVGCAPLPMAHGLTLGEAALWLKERKRLDLSLRVVPMKNYRPSKEAWPDDRPWVPPSPNMTGPDCAAVYPGAVLLEGTEISEGRGTAFPFRVFGAPGLKTKEIKKFMEERGARFLSGAALRPCEFEPVFDKFKGETCRGFQVHLDSLGARAGRFRPYRFFSLFLKGLREIHPDFAWLKPPPYEYETEKLPIDIISGGEDLRKWLESKDATAEEWDERLREEERLWEEERAPFLLYK